MRRIMMLTVLFCGVVHADESTNKTYMIEKFDQNNDHIVTQEEFLKSAEERFKTMDIDSDESIEKVEFLQRYAEHSHTTSDSAVEVGQRVFDKLDEDKDGRISKDEYTKSRLKWFSEVDNDNNQKIEL
ncbi:MAG: EF-hand domain-containing protein [Methylococcaceae bacterium]